MQSELVEAHLPCPDCSSSDAYSIYSDGHGYCFSCRVHIKDAQVPDREHKISKEKDRSVSQFVQGSYQDLPDRNLFEKTLKLFKYTIKDGRHYAPYFNRNGQYVAQKVRDQNKEFWAVGDMKSATLFGQQLWKSGGKKLVVLEGEIDCMSYAQVSGYTWECVSIPKGAQGAAAAIRQELEFVESFGEVIFCFDNDEPGQNAALECSALLSPGKAFIARLPLKDANEMLVNNRGADLKQAIYSAKEFRPDGIRRGAELSYADIIKASPRGLHIEYPELDKMIRGIRKRELILFTAGSGIGKSTIVRELGVHLLREHQQKVGWVMLEESVQKTAQGIVAIDNNVPLMHLVEEPKLIEEPDWQKSMAELVNHSAFYDSFGSTEVDNLMSKMRYLAIGCQCDFIILDHVSMVVSGLDVEERKTIDILMTKLRQFCEQTGVGVLAVSHLKRNAVKGSFNEGAEVSLNDLRGSAGLEQISDIVIGLERDQQAEDEQKANRIQFRVLKNRPFGTTGVAGYSMYDRNTGRLIPWTKEFDEEREHADIPF